MLGEIFCYTTKFPGKDDTSGQTYDPLCVLKATRYLDTVYLHEAMNILDWPKFRISMHREIYDRIEGKHFFVIQITSPKDSHSTPSSLENQTEERHKTRLY